MRDVEITMVTRDPDGLETGSVTVVGMTDDDGSTVTLGLGYLPGIGAARDGDVTVRVRGVEDRQPRGVTVVEDLEVGSQTLELRW